MRYLIRGAINPLDNMNQTKYIIENHTGGNIGNMLFTNSIARSVFVDDDTVLDFINTSRAVMNKKYAEYVNENYDCFLIPLANAFKMHFVSELKKITEFVKMLTIPCAVIGVGIQQQRNVADFYEAYPYNAEVEDFVKAILEKSAMIGVRGELTAEYLGKLGFRAETDYTVIGCPSMYTWGEYLPEMKPLNINEQSVISLNSKTEFEKQKRYKPFLEFAKSTIKAFPNSIYIQQQIDDIRMMYLDCLNQDLVNKKFYPIESCMSFTNVHSWFDYIRKNVDLSVGTRIHGSVAAILAGTPAIVLPYDKRVLELSEYHELPLFPYEAVNGDVTVYDMLSKVDFNAMYKNHKARFNHYLDFLNKIGVDSIFNHKYENGITPYDKIVASTAYDAHVLPFNLLGSEEKYNRLREAFIVSNEFNENKLKESKKKNDKLKNKNIELTNEINLLKDENTKLNDKINSSFILKHFHKN